LTDVSTVLIERHRLSGADVDLGTAALNLGVPRFRRAWIGLAIEAANELHGQPRALLGREAKNVGKDVARSHQIILAARASRARG
jgi:hypothetical protein